MKKTLIIGLFLILAACGGDDRPRREVPVETSHSLWVLASGQDTHEYGFWYMDYVGTGIKNATIIISYPGAIWDAGPYIEQTYNIQPSDIVISGDAQNLTFDFACLDCGFNFWADIDFMPGHPGFTNGATIAETGTMVCAEFTDGQSACADFVKIGNTRSEAIVEILP